MVKVQQVCMFLKSTTGEHEQNGTGLLHIYIRKEVMVWQQGDGKEPRRPKNM